jgi:hypothetical protein
MPSLILQPMPPRWLSARRLHSQRTSPPQKPFRLMLLHQLRMPCQRPQMIRRLPGWMRPPQTRQRCQRLIPPRHE